MTIVTCFEQDVSEILERLTEYGKKHNKVVILEYHSPHDKSKHGFPLTDKLAPPFARISVHNKGVQVMEELFVPSPGEEIGNLSSNSRKKVVVSNSGFPYPVPQQSKKRK